MQVTALQGGSSSAYLINEKLHEQAVTNKFVNKKLENE